MYTVTLTELQRDNLLEALRHAFYDLHHDAKFATGVYASILRGDMEKLQSTIELVEQAPEQSLGN